jgi:protein MpaA
MSGVRLALVLAAVAAAAGVGGGGLPAPSEVVGRSVERRPIGLLRIGDRVAPQRVLVVGCIHGSEPAGLAVTRALRHATPPAGVQLLVVDAMNPDGCAHGTRVNAHGVDLNRNFPTGWRPLTGLYASGPRPSSEPETRAAEALILRERPAASIWFHQHMNGVDLQRGSSVSLMRRYARIAGMRTFRLASLPGTVARWANHRMPGTSAFVVELPAGWPAPAAVARHVRAVLGVAAAVRTP